MDAPASPVSGDERGGAGGLTIVVLAAASKGEGEGHDDSCWRWR